MLVVQVAVLLGVAAMLLRPWWLVTRHRCGLCRSRTPRRARHCRFCGASVKPQSAARTPSEARTDPH